MLNFKSYTRYIGKCQVIVLDSRKVRLVIHILDKRGGILVFDNDRVAPKME